MASCSSTPRSPSGSFAEVTIVDALGSDLIAAGADLSTISETLDEL